MSQNEELEPCEIVSEAFQEYLVSRGPVLKLLAEISSVQSNNKTLQ
jgi:hypothetical protein